KRDVPPACNEFGHAIAGICREPIAAMEIDDGGKGTTSVRLRQVAFNRVWSVRRQFTALASLTLLDLSDDKGCAVELHQVARRSGCLAPECRQNNQEETCDNPGAHASLSPWFTNCLRRRYPILVRPSRRQSCPQRLPFA